MSARAAIINAVGDTYSEMPIREVMRGSDAILSALRSAGFAVVPVEPTKEMLGAGATSLVNDQDHKGVPQMAVSPAYGAYKAMLKAAQEANHG